MDFLSFVHSALASGLVIVTPVLDDWASLERLAAALGALVEHLGPVSLVIVDDGSTEALDPARLAAAAQGLSQLRVIKLSCNLGHQRAIAIGLASIADDPDTDLVIVMDADGEDRPEDIPSLLERHRANPEAIIVAQRAERTEGLTFRILYAGYKTAFRVCSGVTIDFGNFCLVPARHLHRLIARPEIWNHLAATIIKSRAPIERVPTARGRRYTGESRMNLVSLVAHGLSGISVFATETFVRFLVVAFGLMALVGVTIATAIGIRMFTGLAIPGWATTVVGISFVIFLQLAALSAALTFVMLSNRLAAPVVVTVHGKSYIQSVSVIA